jgi:ribonuclease BN (tRNA processing enzyme)
MLEFIGCGSAFNTEIGNNSAFFKIDNGDTMYLIDCGSSIFERIIKFNVLDNVKRLIVLVTHMHPDHIGSLGDLIFYTYYVKGFKTEVYYPNMSSLHMMLGTVGVNMNLYEVYSYDHRVEIASEIVKHVKEIPSWSYWIKVGNIRIQYSGDTYEIPEHIVYNLEHGLVDVLYQDTCGLDYEGNVHLYYGKLRDAIPLHLRRKVWCMHLDKAFNKDQAIADRFNVVEPIR